MLVVFARFIQSTEPRRPADAGTLRGRPSAGTARPARDPLYDCALGAVRVLLTSDSLGPDLSVGPPRPLNDYGRARAGCRRVRVAGRDRAVRRRTCRDRLECTAAVSVRRFTSDTERGAGFGLVCSVYVVIGASGSVIVGVLSGTIGWAVGFSLLVALVSVAVVAGTVNRVGPVSEAQRSDARNRR